MIGRFELPLFVINKTTIFRQMVKFSDSPKNHLLESDNHARKLVYLFEGLPRSKIFFVREGGGGLYGHPAHLYADKSNCFIVVVFCM